MPTPTKHEERLEEVFDLVRKREEEVMKAVRSWMSTVRDTLPVEFPLAFELTREFLDFTEELLRIQREFAHDMVVETHALMHQLAEGQAPRATPAHRAPATPRPTTATKAPRARKTAA